MVDTTAALAALGITPRPNSTCAIGDSLFAGTANGNSLYGKLIRRCGGAIRDRGNFAVAGLRSDQIIGTPGNPASQLLSAAASGAGTCDILVGRNDIAQKISGYLANLKINVAYGVTYLRAAGVEPRLWLIPPTNTAGDVPDIVAYNVWLTLYCMYNNITLIDTWTLLATGAGAYQSGLNADATHPNTVGADLVATSALTQIRTSYNVLPLLAFTDTASDAGTFISNAITMTDSNSDGIPDNWFSNGSGGTYSITAADANTLGKWFRNTISAGTNVGLTPTAVTLASLGWSIGDTLIFGCNIRWTDTSQALTQSINLTGITVSGNQPMFQEKGGATGDSETVYAEVGIASGTTINFNAFASGTGYYEINRPIIVNKTKLGF